VRFRATFVALFRAVQAPMRAAVEGWRCFVSGAGEIETQQKREVCFALRSERFRRIRRKSL
jgi:hypothetical protein